MSQMDMIAWTLAAVGIVTVGIALFFILFLVFEDPLRKLFKRPRRLNVPLDDNDRKNH